MTRVCQQGFRFNNYSDLCFRARYLQLYRMQINYLTVSIILLVLLALVVWLVIRNRKDEKDFEKDEIDLPLMEPEDPDKE
jgi:hypothetical protein